MVRDDEETTAPGAGMPADRLNEIGILTRREIEARIVGPLLEGLAAAFGRERVLAVAGEVIARIAREQGAERAAAVGGNTLAHFAASMEAWQKEDALRIEWLAQTDDELAYNVTRCRYAEMYRALGLAELGTLLSCNRDFALIEGFNPEIALARTQTIMEGQPCCDFRYRRRRPAE